MSVANFGSLSFDCRLVIFDKDGTLLDPFPLWKELCSRRVSAIKELAGLAEKDLAVLVQSLGVKDGRILPDGPFALASSRDEQVVTATVLYQLGLGGFDTCRRIAADAYAQAESELDLASLTRAVKGAVDCIKALKAAEIKCAVATTDSQKRTLNTLKIAGFSDLFDAIVTSDMVSAGKPDPEMIEYLLKYFNISRKSAVMVGDSPSDMQFGRNAGIGLSVGVLSGTGTTESLRKCADVIIQSVAEITVG
ncbi:MAG: HAD family hydrolase [Bacillota bacterium]